MENGEGSSSPVLSLQWHQHHNTLVSLLDSLWERQELVDVTLAADGQSLDVHRIVLCACSKYFQDLLTRKSNIEKQIIIFLKDVSYSNLRALVDYMYKGEVRINEDQLDSFLDTAKSLGIRGLMGETKQNEAQAAPIKKRRRSNSVEVASDQEASQPAPAALRHRNCISKPFDVKSEPPSQTSSHYRQEVEVRESLTQPSSIQSSQELDEEDLDLFQPCNLPSSNMNNFNHHANHQGTSRQPAQELNPPSQGYVDHHIGWGMHNGSIDNHHHAMNNHVSHPDIEPEPGRHSCPRCGRTYKWKQTLLRHMKYECGVEPQFICPVCRAPFHHRNVLQRHMNLHSRPK